MPSDPTPRQIIARFLFDQMGCDDTDADLSADALLSDLADAGYSICPPGSIACAPGEGNSPTDAAETYHVIVPVVMDADGETTQ